MLSEVQMIIQSKILFHKLKYKITSYLDMRSIKIKLSYHLYSSSWWQSQDQIPNLDSYFFLLRHWNECLYYICFNQTTNSLLSLSWMLLTCFQNSSRVLVSHSPCSGPGQRQALRELRSLAVAVECGACRKMPRVWHHQCTH